MLTTLTITGQTATTQITALTAGRKYAITIGFFITALRQHFIEKSTHANPYRTIFIQLGLLLQKCGPFLPQSIALVLNLISSSLDISIVLHNLLISASFIYISESEENRVVTALLLKVIVYLSL